MLAASCAMAIGAYGCTIFVLTDGRSTLFCNNEDFSNPTTRVWFVPAGTNFFGCVYVGFDNGWAQGGMNSEGLAFDWVAGGNFDYMLDTKLKSVRGNSSQRMLESCRTVEEAISFYQTHREASFTRARIMVAERSGASAIVGARNGEVYAERSSDCRGFGYAGESIKKALARNPAVTVDEGMRILRAARQEGEFATKYSNVFDLNSGDLHIVAAGKKTGVKLNLAAELARGGHYFDIPQLDRQAKLAQQPLLQNMRRLPLDAYKTIPDHAPEITAKVKSVLEASARDGLRETDFAPGLWKTLRPQAEDVREQLRQMGKLISMTRVETDPGDSARSHRYRIDFDYATILVGYVLDEDGKIAAAVTDDVEQKSR
jgi:hypothetical protein